MLNLRTLGFGLTFGLLDAVSLPTIKSVSIGSLGLHWMIVPFLLYAVSPFIFLFALKTETLTIMNLVWDLTSDLIVTFIGLVLFGETIGYTKALGVCMSFVALFLMSYESEAFESTLAGGVRSIKETFRGKL
jgi:multidrug transporter EmrE-like cation transporter